MARVKFAIMTLAFAPLPNDHRRVKAWGAGRDAMWRFGSKRPGSEVWDEPIDGPLGDIEAAERIRSICRSAADSAGHTAQLAGNGRRAAQKKLQAESDRYERAAKAAMEIAMKMSDELMRDAAVREIVDLCLAANNTRTAKILFRAIQAPAIRDMVLRDHPEIGGSP
jgi:hypothetical protein